MRKRIGTAAIWGVVVMTLGLVATATLVGSSFDSHVWGQALAVGQPTAMTKKERQVTNDSWHVQLRMAQSVKPKTGSTAASSSTTMF